MILRLDPSATSAVDVVAATPAAACPGGTPVS
jgi:hypothetical protein